MEQRYEKIKEKSYLDLKNSVQSIEQDDYLLTKPSLPHGFER